MSMIPNKCVQCDTEPNFIRHPIAKNKPMDWVMFWTCKSCDFASYGTDDFGESVRIWNANNDHEIWNKAKKEINADNN